MPFTCESTSASSIPRRNRQSHDRPASCGLLCFCFFGVVYCRWPLRRHGDGAQLPTREATFVGTVLRQKLHSDACRVHRNSSQQAEAYRRPRSRRCYLPLVLQRFEGRLRFFLLGLTTNDVSFPSQTKRQTRHLAEEHLCDLPSPSLISTTAISS